MVDNNIDSLENTSPNTECGLKQLKYRLNNNNITRYNNKPIRPAINAHITCLDHIYLNCPNTIINTINHKYHKYYNLYITIKNQLNTQSSKLKLHSPQ